MSKPNLLFLDIDGVLNSQVFYEKRGWPSAEVDYETANICPDRLKWISELCRDTNTLVVVSSTWRHGKTVEELQAMFDRLGATFQVADITPSLHFRNWGTDEYMPSVPRGTEIQYYLKKTSLQWGNYAIIDDDGDMLLEQAPHFFQTDAYVGLTPFICGRIENFFNNVRKA